MARIIGDRRNNILIGTNEHDEIEGRGDDDRLRFGRSWLRAARCWLGCCLALALLLLDSYAAAAVPPNIIVMLTDDQRWDALGVVQRELGRRGRFPWFRAATPHLDALAADGYRFRNAFVVSALCSPSRAAFLTGRYNHLNGVTDNSTPLPVASKTFATLLRAAGYRTGFFGKWHMGRQRARPGFDEYASYVGQGRYFGVELLVDGVPTATAGWVDDVVTTHALDFIRRHAGRPFLMVLGFKSPHVVQKPPPRLSARFASATLAKAPSATAYAPYDPTPEPADLTILAVRNYFRTLVGVDENVGRVLEALDGAGVARDTVVVFASDNGYFLGEHGIPGRVVVGDNDGNKRNAYEESIRIPLLVRYPRLGRRGVVLDAPVLNIDLAPTLLELAGVARPASFQGTSLVPQLTGRAGGRRIGFLYEYFREPEYIVPALVALRRGRYKLVRYPGQPTWDELFDLGVDPRETRNLAHDAASQALLGMMNRALDREMARMGYRVPPGGDPGLRPAYQGIEHPARSGRTPAGAGRAR
jgi:arylsulfatase A-like enzyme